MGTRYTIEGNVPKGQVVDPKGSQPRYTKGAAAHQTSKELKSFQQCVAEEMTGASGSRADIRAAFRDAAEGCK